MVGELVAEAVALFERFGEEGVVERLAAAYANGLACSALNGNSPPAGYVLSEVEEVNSGRRCDCRYGTDGLCYFDGY